MPSTSGLSLAVRPSQAMSIGVRPLSTIELPRIVTVPARLAFAIASSTALRTVLPSPAPVPPNRIVPVALVHSARSIGAGSPASSMPNVFPVITVPVAAFCWDNRGVREVAEHVPVDDRARRIVNDHDRLAGSPQRREQVGTDAEHVASNLGVGGVDADPDRILCATGCKDVAEFEGVATDEDAGGRVEDHEVGAAVRRRRSRGVDAEPVALEHDAVPPREGTIVAPVHDRPAPDRHSRCVDSDAIRRTDRALARSRRGRRPVSQRRSAACGRRDRGRPP